MGALESEVERVFAPLFASAVVALREWVAQAAESSDGHVFEPEVVPWWLGGQLLRAERHSSSVLVSFVGASGSASVAPVSGPLPSLTQEVLLADVEGRAVEEVSARLREVFRGMSETGLSPEALTAAVLDGVAAHVLGA